MPNRSFVKFFSAALTGWGLLSARSPPFGEKNAATEPHFRPTSIRSDSPPHAPEIASAGAAIAQLRDISWERQSPDHLAAIRAPVQQRAGRLSSVAIASTWDNQTMSDLRTEMTNSLDRNGRGGMLAQFLTIDGTACRPGVEFHLSNQRRLLPRVHLGLPPLAGGCRCLGATTNANFMYGPGTAPSLTGAFTGVGAGCWGRYVQLYSGLHQLRPFKCRRCIGRTSPLCNFWRVQRIGRRSGHSPWHRRRRYFSRRY